MEVSWSPWWCHPETMCGAVLTKPAHMSPVVTARSRTMPGVCSPSTRSSGRIRDTGSKAAKTILCQPSQPDRRHWDERHAEAGPASGDPGPPSVFAPIEDLFPVEGSALEIASGRGELSVWLALRGMDVLGVDVSPVAIEFARELAQGNGIADQCRFEVWDSDEGLPPGPPVDLVVCHMYRSPGWIEN